MDEKSQPKTFMQVKWARPETAGVNEGVIRLFISEFGDDVLKIVSIEKRKTSFFVTISKGGKVIKGNRKGKTETIWFNWDYFEIAS